MDAMDPLQQHLARFDRDGFAVLDFAQLPSETVDAYRQSLEPWADSQIAPNGPQQPETFRDPDRCVDRWTRARGFESYWEGRTRLAASNALLQLSACGDTATLTLDFMLQKELLRFSEMAFKTAAMRIDSVQVACYPRVGEGWNEGHPSASAETKSELQGWHRDTANLHGALRKFHLSNSKTDGHGESGEEPAAYMKGPPIQRNGPVVPVAINFMTYLQESELRVLPGSHADLTELSFGQFNLTGRAKLPHPREQCIQCKPGQVIAIHNNLLHSGMLNNSSETRRYYVSLFFTRLGLPSRNLPSLVQEAGPDHPLHCVLQRALVEGDEQVLCLFGEEARMPASERSAAATPYDFLVSLGTADVAHAASHTGQCNPLHSGAFLAHLSSTSALLASWGCDGDTQLAGLYHSVYGTAAFDLFSLPMGVQQRQTVANIVGGIAERVVFINCTMERGSQDELHAAVLRNPEMVHGDSLVIASRAGLDLVEAGWPENNLRLRNARELEMLILVSMADWLQQAEDVDANGFGGSDRSRQSYWMRGKTPGHWMWVGKGGIRGFRAKGYRQMLELLDCLKSPAAAAARLSFSLVYERLETDGPVSMWVPEAACSRL